MDYYKRRVEGDMYLCIYLFTYLLSDDDESDEESYPPPHTPPPTKNVPTLICVI